MKDNKVENKIDELLEEARKKAEKEKRKTVVVPGDISTTHIPINWYSDSSKEKDKTK